jgi:beta-glucosidase
MRQPTLTASRRKQINVARRKLVSTVSRTATVLLSGLGRLSWAAVGTTVPKRSTRADSGQANEAEVVESFLRRMTLAEKLGQLTQLRGRVSDKDANLPPGSDDRIRAGAVGSFLGLHGAAETARAQRIAIEESRLGIPLLFADDVIHGFRTIFPVPIAEAASFDLKAIEEAARVAAVEASAHGLHWTFAPMVDIARDPRWGRIVEGSGEDPLLGSEIAAARVRGFQGSSLSADDTLLATAKHFIAYGAAEGGRDYNTADISERSLREIYLPPFHAAVQAGAQAVMVAFNDVAGIPMHANRKLVAGILRGEIGFDGVVISDYTGITELMSHGVAGDLETSGALALRAGIDVDMVSGVYLDQIPAALRAGRVSQSDIDEAVRRVLRAKHRAGLFQDPYRHCSVRRQRARTLTSEHRKTARDMACKSMVLLKNEQSVLPLSRQLRTLAVVGPLAEARRAMLGSWIGAGREEDVVTPLEGIRDAVGKQTRVLHAEGASIEGASIAGFSEAEAIAHSADAVLLLVGEDGDISGEARSRSSLALPGVQQDLVLRVLAIGRPTVVVLFAGRPLAIEAVVERASCILLAWFPGIEAGRALADVLFADHNPAGRLPVTFPKSVGQVPVYYDHANTGRPPDPNTPDARAGGKNTSRYFDLAPVVLYPFGHGLSYTSFTYEYLRISPARLRPGAHLTVQVTVTNAGKCAGDEVVQLYLHQAVASVTPPVRRLRGFQRVGLAAGEQREMTFELTVDDLAYVGPDMRPVIETGTFTVAVGGSSASLIEAAFELERT